MLSKKNIPLPTTEEKNKSIDYILAHVSIQPKNFLQFIVTFFIETDWRIAFWGLKEIFIISGSIILSLFLYIGTLSEWQINMDPLLLPALKEDVYFTIFLLSPVIYGVLHYLSLWKEIQLRTYELKMTLKIALKDILIVRSLVFSVLSLFVSTILSAFAWLMIDQQVSLFKLIGVASVSLFFFLSIQIAIDQIIPVKLTYIVSPIFWLIVGCLLIFIKKKVKYLIVLLPNLVVLLLSVLFMSIFVLLLRHTYMTKKEGDITYARTEIR